MSHMPIPNEDKTKALVERLFPVLNDYRLREEIPALRAAGVQNLVVGFPWAIIAPHERQAQKNHSQTLARLAERGGLSACEAIAVLTDQPWRRMTFAESHRRLAEIVRERTALEAQSSSSATMRAALVEIGAIKSDVHQAIGLLVEGGLKEIPVELTQAGHRLYELERRIDAALNAGGEGRCPDCRGSGNGGPVKTPEGDWHDYECPTCKGSGRKASPPTNAHGTGD
jgi:hypothetical protein